MPTYELSLLLRCMPREEMVSCLKRTATAIFDKGGFIRKIDNLGRQPTPFKMSAEYGPHREANYFLIHFEAAPYCLEDLKSLYARDIDIVRKNIFKKSEPFSAPCTLDEELKPPAYRKEVQQMIELAIKKKNIKPKSAWAPNSGLDYYPFQR